MDKPAGHTSHDVVARLRGMARTRRVGHAGTLDPMATGVLLIGIGRATRLLGHLALTDKEYTATVRLGQTTVTDDAEGEVTASAGTAGLPPGATEAAGEGRAALEAAVARLTGDILQVPSKVSAIKVDGKRSYKRAREGEEFELAARPVSVPVFTVRTVRAAVADDGTAVLDADVTVVCSSGTYVRALARDLGAALGTGGHLTALRRTRVGPYGLDAAHTLEELQTAVDAAGEAVNGLPVMPLAEARRRPSRAGTRTRSRPGCCRTASAWTPPASPRAARRPSSARTGVSWPWWRARGARRGAWPSSPDADGRRGR